MGPLKTTPTDLDREAARLFDAAQGMMAWHCAWNGVEVGPERVTWVYAGINKIEGRYTNGPVEAFDTDDPATGGVMLAQVESVKPGAAVTIVDRLNNLAHELDRRFQVIVTGAEGWQSVHTGPTRGAALVAAMRALKGASNGR